MYKNLKSLKALLIAMLLIVSCFVFFGCGGGGDSESAEESSDAPVASEDADTVTEEEANLPAPTEEDAKALAEEFFEPDTYEDGMNFDYELAEDFKSVTIDGKKFKAGISYDDVLGLGWKPVDESFADEEPSTLILINPFVNSKGKTVQFGFAVDDDTKLVKEGNLYYFGSKDTLDNPAELLVDGIGVGSSIEDVVKAFGNKPYILKTADFYMDGYSLRAKYAVDGTGSELELVFNPLTRKVFEMGLQKHE